MYRENYINALQSELLEIVAEQLTPVAMRWGYSEVPLETNIKWRPLVLILGNYSSGKSTLINELLGGDIQAAGQAPTDDSFTIITYDDSSENAEAVTVTEERDGKFLLHDSEYPFESLKKHGQRFAAHFRLKKVNSPFLKNLAIIDTPGMLDSITERDRGYDYQEVIGDLAQIADLVLVLFDPHKAGTVREAHTSLRHTLPARTFEDRVIFVLNRIDECASMMDLLRVYGTLCWNLSQITGRKDIPFIHLTYSPKAAKASAGADEEKQRYLAHLENHRDTLKKSILDAPCHRLDNLATFVETHSERLAHFLEALISFRKRTRRLFAKSFFSGLLLSAACGAGAFIGMFAIPFLGGLDPSFQIGGSCAAAVLAFFIWISVVH
ncbi:MAG: dynamin family protein, partial [Desulfosarcinaceae bacterium]